MPIVIPEFTFLTVLQGLRDSLKTGRFWRDQRSPVLAGVPVQDLEDFQKLMKDKPLNVGFIYPQTEADLPSVTLATDEWTTQEALLGELVSEVPEAVQTVTGYVVVASATAGQASGRLAHGDIVPGSVVLTRTPFAGVAAGFTTFTVNTVTGVLVFTVPLTAGDAITAAYDRYSDSAIRTLGEISQMQTRLFIEATHPTVTYLLAALIWRELRRQPDVWTAAGIQNLSMSVVALSPWTDVLPTIAFRREVVLTYHVEQTVEFALPGQARQYQVRLVDRALRGVVSVDVDASSGG